MNRAGHDFGVVVGEVPPEILLLLDLRPAVEQFFHQQNALALAYVEVFRAERVVRQANRVAAHVGQDVHLPLNGAAVLRRADAPAVVVDANALELRVDAVEIEARVLVESDASVAVGNARGLLHPLADFHADLGFVEVRWGSRQKRSRRIAGQDALLIACRQPCAAAHADDGRRGVGGQRLVRGDFSG